MSEIRKTLKQLLSGSLTAQEAESKLHKDEGSNIAIYGTDGLYSIGSKHGLTKQQVYQRVSGKGILFILPDNGRDERP